MDGSRPGLFWPVAIDPDGITGPTRAQARGRHWVREAHGLYLPTGLEPRLRVDQRIVTAAAVMPQGGAITGWAALRWGGARHLDGHRRGSVLSVTIAVPPSTRDRRPGIDLTSEAGLRSRLIEVDGLTLTSYEAATAFEVRHAASLQEAVAMIDRACAADLVSLDELRAHRRESSGTRWVRRLDAAIELADENVWSPMESVMRLCWRDLGVTDVVCNRPVFGLDGSFLGTPDLLDVETGLVGEYDGSLHLAGHQRAKDIRREGAFRRVGLEYVEMVAADQRDMTDFARRTLDARARTGTSPRGWTLVPPPGWVETHTVDLRRALSTGQRARFLRWQAS
ncbi:hypothetical protein ASE01_19810 [Nocardioides sp. Root190]|nr:hypothetical protein ASE01_19810 [Nocardioides sp. Root190]